MTEQRTSKRLLMAGVQMVARIGDLWIIFILLALVAFFTIMTPEGRFFSVDNFWGIAVDTSAIILLAAGQTFVMIAAGIDLSIGSIVIFNGVVAASLLGQYSGPASEGYPDPLIGLAVAIPATLAAGVAWGWLNGWITVRLRVPPFITTLGTLWMALGFAQILSGGLNVASVPQALPQNFSRGGLFDIIPWPVVVTAVIVGVLWIVLAHTRYGLRTYALGANREALRRAGVNVNLHAISLYILMGALCAVVGLMDVARFSTASLSAHTLDNLNAIAAVVIGGTSLFGGRGRMSGTIVGAFIPAVLRNGFILMAIQPFWQNVVIGAFLILAVFVDQLRRSGFFMVRTAPLPADSDKPPEKASG